ncbi:DUF6710 family protein [Paenibacillus jamilae]|uniref:DUF6710 family protein n=1 Tax=Paenibacillus jamilae TaxID=114136 RepID=UPI0012E8E39B|nr:DUF6710 family protein [Paenibacillus jamilae]
MLKIVKNLFVNSTKSKLSVYNQPINESDNDKKQLFDNMIEAVKDTISQNDELEQSPLRHPIYDLIKMIGLRIQAKYLTNKLYDPSHSRLPDITFNEVFFKKPIEDRCYINNYLKQLPNESYSVSLKDDLVLPWPWNYDRLIGSLVSIGEDRHWGDWKMDDLNHNVELWLPMRIVFIIGGNHSITAGIVQGIGTLKPNYVFDMSPIYDHVYTDGVYYYRKDDNSKLEKVNEIEFAVLFEVGRIMIEKGLY